MDIRVCDVRTHEFVSKDDFKQFCKKERTPVVLRNVDIGPCRFKWTVDYLSELLGDNRVKVHISPTKTMSFLQKNFSYKTLPFSDFIRRVSCDGRNDPVTPDEEFYYLRSIGSDKRGRDVADIKKQFPCIAGDINFPELFDEEDFFSSVFRISSAGVQIWTHYDIVDNMLIQVVGNKRVVLYSPSDAPNLYLNGDKSEVLDIDNPDSKIYPNFFKAKRYECVLNPGDVLFIPALWFHNTIALTYGISVNVFWKNLPHELYDKSDVYGNKDLVPAAKALALVDKCIQLLDGLPEEYRNFYLQRAIVSLTNEITDPGK